MREGKFVVSQVLIVADASDCLGCFNIGLTIDNW